MAIDLPIRNTAGPRRNRAAGLPDSADIRPTQAPRDPGVSIPDGAFDSGGAAIGSAVDQAGSRLFAAAQRMQTREDTVARAKAITSYNEAVNTEMRRLETEGDFSDPQTTQAFGKFLGDKRTEILGSHSGSEDSQANLDIRLEGIRSTAANRAGEMAAKAQRKLVTDHLGQQINGITAAVIDDPKSLPDMIESLDGVIDDLAPALAPDEEEAYRRAGRQEITVTALTGLMTRGDLTGARSLHDSPGVREMLTPAQQRQFDSTFAEYDRKKSEARLNAQKKVEEAEYIKGGGSERVPLTLTERLKIAGLPDDDDNPASKVRNLEQALGRRLTPAEKEGVLGVKRPDAQSDAGKLVRDREMFVSQFGDASPQVAAFDEAAKSEGAPDLSKVSGVRKEFTGLSKDFVLVRDSFGRIAEVARSVRENPGKDLGAGDLALIFNFMKMLDPGSTVREGEFANAQNTGGVPARITARYNQVINGQRLTPEQRSDFVAQAENLMHVQLSNQKRLENSFRGIADRAGINPDDVVVDFVGPLRQSLETNNPGGAGGENTPTPTNNIISLDAEGNVIGGGAPKEGAKND